MYNINSLTDKFQKLLTDSRALDDNRPVLWLIAVIALIYLKTLSFTFSPLDDPGLIVNRLHLISQLSYLPNAFLAPIEMAGATYFYRPVLEISFIMDAFIGQGIPFTFHLTNLLLHIVATIMTFEFLKLLNISKNRASFLALIFAVHPLNVSVAAWIPARNDSLLAVFVLASLYTYHKSFLKNSLYYQIGHYILFTLALLTKENAVVLPFILLLYHHFVLRKRLREIFIPGMLWTIIITLWMLLRQTIMDFAIPSHIRPVDIFVIDIVKIWVISIGKIIFPVYQSVMPHLKDTPLFPGIFALIFLIAIFSIFKVKNRNIVIFGFTFAFIISFIPIIWGAVFGVSDSYEHRLYLPLAGILISLSQIEWNYQGKNLTPAVFLAGCLIVTASSVKSFVRSDVYRNEDRFSLAATEESPSLWRTYAIRGDVATRAGAIDEAISLYNTTIEKMTMVPDKSEIYYARGNLYHRKSDFEKAMNDYQVSVTYNPEFADVYYNMGLIYRQQNKYETAIDNFLKAINTDPENSIFYNDLGVCYLNMKNYDAAVRNFTTALELSPGHPGYLLNRCIANMFSEKYQPAYTDYLLLMNMNIPIDRNLEYQLLIRYFQSFQQIPNSELR